MTSRPPVELHVISDSDRRDRRPARARARGAVPGAGVRGDPPPARRDGRRPPPRRRPGQGPAGGDRLHARRAGAARGTRAICRRYKLHYCDLLGHPIEAVARVTGVAAKMTPGARRAARLAVLQADGGDRVRGQVRRRRRRRASTRPTSSSSACRAPRRRRSRCTSATSATRPRTCPLVKGIDPPSDALRDRPDEDRRPDDRRRAARRRSASSAPGGSVATSGPTRS